MARKSFLATVVGIAAFAVPNAFADKGGIPHDGSNGQGRSAAQQQQQKAATAPHGKALAKGHAKANTQAQAQGQTKVNTHAKAGKTTLCHATGSSTNPYVTITISNNAVPAHQRHQDGRDIIPAPEGGCPAGSQEKPQQPGTEQGSTPGTETQTMTQTPAGTTPATGTEGQSGVLGESTSGSNGSNATPNNVDVLGASTGSAPSASSSPAATGTRASSSSGLPFTGTDAIIVALLGLAALLLGVTVRRATTNRA